MSINKGAIFCHVKIINKISHDICFVILGSQKWRGAPPSFMIRDIIIKVLMIVLVNIEYQDIVRKYIIIEEIIKTLELTLWIIKYLIEASASKTFPLILIKGKKPIRLSSKPIHIVNQCEDESENRVPISIIIKNKKLEGKNLLFIKGRTVRAAQNKVSSFILYLITFKAIKDYSNHYLD